MMNVFFSPPSPPTTLASSRIVFLPSPSFFSDFLTSTLFITIVFFLAVWRDENDFLLLAILVALHLELEFLAFHDFSIAKGLFDDLAVGSDHDDLARSLHSDFSLRLIFLVLILRAFLRRG